MTAAALQPPFAYFGGKTTLASRIVDLIPPHEHYAEVFCGGSSVLLAKAPSTMETVNDLDGRLIYLDMSRRPSGSLERDRSRSVERACAGIRTGRVYRDSTPLDGCAQRRAG